MWNFLHFNRLHTVDYITILTGWSTERNTKLRTSSSAMIGEASQLSMTLLLTAVVIVSSGAPVDWISSPVDQERQLNSTATFDCLVGGGGVGDRTVLWTKTNNGTRQTLFIDETPFDAPTRYRSRRANDGSGYRLTISSIDTSTTNRLAALRTVSRLVVPWRCLA